MTFKFLKDFKDFAVKGNMIDIAIGVIIGAAFNRVIDSLVKQVFMPPLSLLTDDVTLENKKWILREAVLKGEEVLHEEVAIGYGALLESGIDFLIIAFTVFLMVKAMNSLKKKAEDPGNTTVSTPKDIELLTKISDLMEKQVALLEKK
ncbi:large conductance mechanosensitive channel protein MscL [Jiulongibacter sediminis]|jgi:large conductance mechanosensitive channel|uniref:large conductance mechanosensitive channel protein MscL n=1 Tax=Jiulongibacter sediminis TaxID=1605367 RepID=UPI0026F0A1EF|nr:large conductance mechanosensitive channel protein MscL [Jiulongibacter sediminis]